MAVSYKKLWKLLIDRDMKKKELAQLAGISNFTISKMSAGNNVTVEVLGKICKALNCTLDDIMEFIPEENLNEEFKLEVSEEIFKEALEDIKVLGRSELVDNKLDLKIMIDYAHTPDSLENILKTVKQNLW